MENGFPISHTIPIQLQAQLLQIMLQVKEEEQFTDSELLILILFTVQKL